MKDLLAILFLLFFSPVILGLVCLAMNEPTSEEDQNTVLEETHCKRWRRPEQVPNPNLCKSNRDCPIDYYCYSLSEGCLPND